jgi:hypothetical protein
MDEWRTMSDVSFPASSFSNSQLPARKSILGMKRLESDMKIELRLTAHIARMQCSVGTSRDVNVGIVMVPLGVTSKPTLLHPFITDAVWCEKQQLEKTKCD